MPSSPPEKPKLGGIGSDDSDPAKRQRLRRGIRKNNLFPHTETHRMVRSLLVLFRRDPSRDRQLADIRYEGYQIFWPDGRPVTTGLSAFCHHGQRLLSLGRYLQGCPERLVELVCFPLRGLEDDLTRIPGHRIRRFFLRREGLQGRIHFLDGTPTDIVFELGRDEPRVLRWIGLTGLREGEEQWFDIAAKAGEAAAVDSPHGLGGILTEHHVGSEVAV